MMLELITQHPLLTATGALLLLGVAFGALLGFAAVKFHVEGNPISEQINTLLPQTQCGQCGYPGCKPYADAVAQGDEINKCVPGGQGTVEAIANLLGVEPTALDAEEKPKQVAFIREDECIGCTKCIQACPVDAILGAAKHMHTVIVSECTGCDLCVEPCPVDCIEMRTIPQSLQTWAWTLPSPIPPEVIASDREHAA